MVISFFFFFLIPSLWWLINTSLHTYKNKLSVYSLLAILSLAVQMCTAVCRLLKVWECSCCRRLSRTNLSLSCSMGLCLILNCFFIVIFKERANYAFFAITVFIIRYFLIVLVFVIILWFIPKRTTDIPWKIRLSCVVFHLSVWCLSQGTPACQYYSSANQVALFSFLLLISFSSVWVFDSHRLE